ncbi:MAG: hypothetical protein GVY26_12210 [Bacteroidetes bacterium]|nr:hypothetical protein [Bacteroidota bacterium]
MNIVQFAGLLLLLVVLPLGSWYYLQTGLDYRMQARKELKDIAPLPDFELQNYNDSLVQMKRFEDQLLVGHFMNASAQDVYTKALAKLHDQFDERQDIYFLAFQTDTSAAGRASTRKLLSQKGLKDTAQVFVLAATEGKLATLAEQMELPLEERGMSLERNSLLFFADSAMVRGFYDIRQEEELKRLVKHLTLNLHPTAEADIIYDPETEK